MPMDELRALLKPSGPPHPRQHIKHLPCVRATVFLSLVGIGVGAGRAPGLGPTWLMALCRLLLSCGV